MRYLSLQIQNYRGIEGPITLELSKHSIVPIVGINECGKTTLLEAILSFDHYNDETNDGRHLKNTDSLKSFDPPDPTVSATIELSQKDAIQVLEEAAPLSDPEREAIRREVGNPAAEYDTLFLITEDQMASIVDRETASMSELSAKRDAAAVVGTSEGATSRITITRNLKTLRYSIAAAPGGELSASTELTQTIADELLGKLPYTLYFDDFRHAVPSRILLSETNDSEWLGILGKLFRSADEKLDPLKLSSMDERIRESALALVEHHLNETLTREWLSFNLEDSETLSIRVRYTGASGSTPPYISFQVVEELSKGQRHFFDLKDRSKGFYWFFNFVMRIQFNPKLRTQGQPGSGTIYLLDEPGSYLHASAQRQLARKLRSLSESSTVIYCTHSHHLLEPEIIPISNMLVISKHASGGVIPQPLVAYETEGLTRHLALQPLFEALQLNPSSIDFGSGKALLVEGLGDFFAFSMFAPDHVRALPCLGANSIRYVLPFVLATGGQFRVLWDNDKAGRAAHDLAREFFGPEIAGRHFRLLKRPEASRKRILQDLFDGKDISYWKRETGLPKNTKFLKVLVTLFYAENRQELLDNAPGGTKRAFAEELVGVFA